MKMIERVDPPPPISSLSTQCGQLLEGEGKKICQGYRMGALNQMDVNLFFINENN